MSDKGDLTIAWSQDKHAEMVEHIQALMDKGVTFHRIDTAEKGKIRKKLVTTATPIASTGEIQDRRLLITDAEIAKLLKGQSGISLPSESMTEDEIAPTEAEWVEQFERQADEINGLRSEIRQLRQRLAKARQRNSQLRGQ